MPDLAPATAARIAESVASARAAGTRRTYASAWRAFTAWCAREGHVAVPAHPVTVAAYLIACADTVTEAGQRAYAPATLAHRLHHAIRRRTQQAGYDPEIVTQLGGHSLRAGFVTQAFRNGASAHAIMRQTGHTTPAMLEVYAREHAPLLGNAVTNLGFEVAPREWTPDFMRRVRA
ncbi:phage integrase family protein [Rhodococcus ruber BKS 20-38]|uniref:Phage integrase family protein n=1 Tax=Rhodococcus ruber BKS 20-38 TaxID=1278076 RepID=M2Z560_9NOCA|nr:phage integrase family protein [Rhodococcus ruber BKS 20-38]